MRVLKWFWEALSHFSTEDMARFVQFVTGSSLLPPGGYNFFQFSKIKIILLYMYTSSNISSMKSHSQETSNLSG